MAQTPLFLERRSYRRRRVMDAVRLLPLLGFVLWMVPLMWALPEQGSEPLPMSQALRYVFGIWILMVVLGVLLWRAQRQPLVADPPPPADDTPQR